MQAEAGRDADADSSEFTLAELGHAADVSPRTIRYYQSEGLLPKPSRRAGQAVYGRHHLDRLRSIVTLQARGLRLQTIRTVLGDSGDSGGTEVVDLLGPGITSAAWLATSARTMDEGELADLLGAHYPERVGALVAAGFLERRTDPEGRKVWFAESVPQLRGALEMHSFGTEFELSRWSTVVMRERIRDLCELLVARWIGESGRGYSGEATVADFAQNLERIRAVAWQTAAHVMAEEIGRALANADELRERLEAGKFEPDAHPHAR